MIWTVLEVALGGAAGSVLRYLTVVGIAAPIGTLVVNVIGSFAMGMLAVGLASRMSLSPLLMTGFLGGFTTFSAFSLDAVRLWEQGHASQAAAYVLASVIFSVAALCAGAALARGVFA